MRAAGALEIELVWDHVLPLCAGTRSFLPHKKSGNSFAKEASIRFLLRLRFRYPVPISTVRPSAGAAMHIQQPFTPLKRPSKAAVKCETWGGRAEGDAPRHLADPVAAL